jgi:hypothetical protein
MYREKGCIKSGSLLGGSHWFITLSDVCIKMTWTCLMKFKSDVNLLFEKLHKMVEFQYKKMVQFLYSDNRGEFYSFKLQ